MLGRPGHLALKLVTRPGAAEVGVHLWRRQQLDERRTVPSLGLAEHEPLGGQATGPSSVTVGNLPKESGSGPTA